MAVLWWGDYDCVASGPGKIDGKLILRSLDNQRNTSLAGMVGG